ncbi:MAG: hypothetical protein AMXMBFR49_13740 [Chlorobiota bacterium]
MASQPRNKVESIIDQVLEEMGCKGHKLFEGLTISDITLLASESFLGDYLLHTHDLEPKLQKLKGFYFAFQMFRIIDKKTSFLQKMVEDDEFNESEIWEFFRLGVVILAFSLKEIKGYTELNFEIRGWISDFFLHYVSKMNYEELRIADIERMQPLKNGQPDGAITALGNEKWSKSNFFGTKNGRGENLIYVTDQVSWEFANRMELPACCSYAFLREFDGVLGLYYNWYAVKEIAISPPAGWKVPDKNDFEQLRACPIEEMASNFGIGHGQVGTSLSSEGHILHDFGHDLRIWSSSETEPSGNSAYCLSVGPANEHVSDIRAEVKGCGLRLRLIQDNASVKAPTSSPISHSADYDNKSAPQEDFIDGSSGSRDFSWGDAVFSNPSTLSIFISWFGSVLNQFVLDRYDSSGWWGLAVAPLMILSLGLIFSGAGYIINRFLKNIDKNDLWGVMSVTLAPVVFSIYAIPIVAIAVLFDWTWMLGIIETIGIWAITAWKVAFFANLIAWLVFGHYSGKVFKKYTKEYQLYLAVIVGCTALFLFLLTTLVK